MEDILEKTTIHIDSDYASFISESEFYVDIVDDIKNCIYIKTLKTEIFVKANYPVSTDDRVNVLENSYIETSIFNDKNDTTTGIINKIERNVFNPGDYLYINLNDIKRINAISKKITVKTFDDIESNINDYNFGLIWTKVDETPNDYDDTDAGNNNLQKYNLISDLDDKLAIAMKKLMTILRMYAKNLEDENQAINIAELNNKIILPKGSLKDIFGSLDYKPFLTEQTYYHEVRQEGGVLFKYRYVPTYIGYTKDCLKINKYTWKVIKNLDPEKAEIIKYLYNEDGPLLNPMNKVYNYKVKKEELNTFGYYDSIYINKPTIYTNLLTSPSCYILSYKHELSGTSCGPNDTNTMILNPILPELKRFNIKLTRINELGEHVDIPINSDGVFRVIMSFTIYYKRKKVTRA